MLIIMFEGLCAKRTYISFWADFHFLQDWANFWQTDLFWHETHRSVIVLLFCTSFYINNICKRTQFRMKRHLYEQIFRRRISMQCELKRLLLATSTAHFFNINIRCFGLWKLISRETDQKNRPTLYWTSVTTKQIHIRSIQHLNHLH